MWLHAHTYTYMHVCTHNFSGIPVSLPGTSDHLQQSTAHCWVHQSSFQTTERRLALPTETSQSFKTVRKTNSQRLVCICYGVCLCADITIQFFKIHGSLTLSSFKHVMSACPHQPQRRVMKNLTDIPTYLKTWPSKWPFFAFHESILVPPVKGGILLSWALS